MNWSDIRYFRANEFASPDQPDSGYLMNLDFVFKLDRLREAVKMPLVIHSGYRTVEHNRSLANSVEKSAHTTGHAADVEAGTSSQRYAILEAAYRLGFRRVGIGETFIHLDDDISMDKPQDVCWLYGKP